MTSVSYWLDSVSKAWKAPGRDPLPSTVDVSADWSDSNVPWAYSEESVFTEKWPAGVTVVDIQTGSSDFFTNLQNTVNAAGKRVVVRLGVGVYSLKSFRLIGASGDPLYSFGFWFPNLQGLLGRGPDKTFVQMDANSMSTAQLSALATKTKASFAPLQMGLARLDGSASSPVLLAGLTFRAADQQNMTTGASDLGIVLPQPAPHNGVVIYPNSHATVSYVRFQAAGRAAMSQPPFELANVSTQYGVTSWNNCEFDGRRSPDLDALRPRRCTVYMGNNETSATMTDCWFHHTNVSRYAVNDENRETTGTYTLIRCKGEQITNTQNKDPNINGGASLGGYENATPFGWESCNGTIRMTDCIVSQDNNQSAGTVPMMLQLTSVGSRNPQGGRLFVEGGEFRNTGWPHLNGFLGFRIAPNTYWWLDGFNTTLNVKDKAGNRLTPYVVTGTWPPTAASLALAGVTPQTHFLIRST